jgi:hypothetical protein
MTPEQFTYWLQGFVELHGELPTSEQWKSIKEHLQTVFVKVTPKTGDKESPKTAEELASEFFSPSQAIPGNGWNRHPSTWPIAITC